MACATPVMPVALASGAKEDCCLENGFISFQVQVRDGKVASRRFVNKLADEAMDLPVGDFALEFDHGAVSADHFAVSEVARGDGQFQIKYAPADNATLPLQVRVTYQLPPRGAYLRKQIELRATSQGAGRKLLRADLENWLGVRRHWKSMRADRLRFGSHPIFCETLWVGVEFVAAFNEYTDQGFILRSRPGGKAIGTDWMKLRSTVMGVAEPGAARESFLRYIEDVRLRPAVLVAAYNSWWSLPPVFKESEFVPLIQTLKERFFDQERVSFDIVTGDMGWSDPHTIWRIDKKNQPGELNRMVEIAEAAHGKPGLWMSPSEVYPDVIDYDWAQKSGYTPVPAKPPHTGLSLADPRYRSEAKQALEWLIKEKRLGHVKYDGLFAREADGHHGLLPGDDSVEPLAEYALELISASLAANPDLVTEPTFLNSHVNYISPWIIKYADFVWGNAGGDCPPGLGPAPDYREAHTTAREYFIFASLNEVWLPQNALQYFDTIHCDEAGGFVNHAAMAFGRGRFFLSTYINPKYMADSDWHVYAGLLQWARRNRELLRHTVILPGRVELGETYAYAHWSGTRGIIALRNPSNDFIRFTLDLAKVKAPVELADAVCYTHFPYRQGIMEAVTGTSTLKIDLGPWELVFLEIVPRAALPEPVAIGARWLRDANGHMTLLPLGPNPVRILLPGGGEQHVTANGAALGNPRGEIRSHRIDRLPERDWLRQADKLLPTASFDLETEISLPEGAVNGKALLLVEFPGDDHLPSACSCRVNGRAARLSESSSAGHIGYNSATPESPWRDLVPYLSQWTWYICELAPGANAVRFTGTFPCERGKMALWVWVDSDLTPRAVPVPVACPEPSLPQVRPHLARQSVSVLPRALPPEPIPSDGSWKIKPE